MHLSHPVFFLGYRCGGLQIQAGRAARGRKRRVLLRNHIACELHLPSEAPKKVRRAKLSRDLRGMALGGAAAATVDLSSNTRFLALAQREFRVHMGDVLPLEPKRIHLSGELLHRADLT